MFSRSFYKTKKHNKKQKTSVPNGNLRSALALVNSPEPYDKKTAAEIGATEEKRALVFADHLYKYRSYEDKKEINRRLQEARENGFVIILLDDDKPDKFSALEEDVEINYGLPLALYSAEYIRKKLYEETHITAEEIYILDYFGINELLSQPRNLLDSFLFELNPNLFYQLISQNPLDEYEISFSSKQAAVYFTELDFTKIPFFPNRIKKIIYHSEEINFAQVDAINNYYVYFDMMKNIKNFTVLKLTHPDSSYVINLDLMPNLETLDLAISPTSNKFFYEHQGEPSNLKKLTLRDADLSTDLSKLINSKLPNLESINFSFSNWDIFQFLDLKNLKEIDISATLPFNGELTNEFKKSFLQFISCKNLHSFKLSNLPVIDDVFANLAPNSWMQLETLTLSCLNFTEEDFNALALAAPSLRHLDISSCTIVSDTPLNPSIKWKKLETLSVEDTHMSNKIVWEILKNASILTDLNLGLFHLDEDFESLNLPCLKNLEIENISSNHMTIHRFIAKSPMLETVSLPKAKQIPVFLFNTPYLHLKQINCSAACIHPLTILKNAPNLESLTFANSVRVEDGLEHKPHLKLRKLDLQHSDIKENDLIKLLTLVPNIIDLKLPRHYDVNGLIAKSDTLNTKSALKRLRFLKLYLMIGSINFPKFTSISPALEKLELHNADLQHPLSSNKMFFTFLRFSYLTEVSFTESHISLEFLMEFIGKNFCLKKLELNYARIIWNQDIEKLNKDVDFNVASKNLKSLGIYGNSPKSHLPPSKLLAFIYCFPMIEELNVANYPYLEELKTQLDLQKLTNLQSLNLFNAPHYLERLAKKAAKPNINISNQALVPEEELVQPLSEKNRAQDPSFFAMENKNPTFNCLCYFKNIHPSRYRLHIAKPDLDSLEYNHIKPNDFISVKIEPLESKNSIIQDGNIEIKKTDSTDIILPSLNPNEKITSLVIYNEHGREIPPSEYELQWSPSTQFYRIQFKTLGHYQIKFEVAYEDPTLHPLPTLLTELQTFYNSPEFKPKENAKENFKSLREVALYVRENKTGRCQLKSIAAYADLTTAFIGKNEHEVRIVENDCHAVVEIKINNYWHQLDLGGYPAQLNQVPIKDPVKMISVFEPIKQQPVADFKEILSEIVNPEEKVTAASPSLFLATNDGAILNFYKQLPPSTAVFIAHNIEELNTTGIGLSAEGEVKKEYTQLNRWLNKNKMGILIVDIRDFSLREIAQLNDLLDYRLGDKDISPAIKIILMDTADNHQFGPDFKRRVPTTTTLPVTNENLLPKATDLEPTETYIIDLSESVFWQRLVMGSYQLRETKDDNQYNFYWQKGMIFDALNNSNIKNIVFKNPPPEDVSFTAFIAELQAFKSFNWADQQKQISPTINTYEDNGYDWQSLGMHATLSQLDNNDQVYVLTDNNILSFIDDEYFDFNDVGDLEAFPSHLLQNKGQINVLCSPTLTAGTLAEFLKAAKDKNIKVNFKVAAINKLISNSPLKLLDLKPLEEKVDYQTLVDWQINTEPYFAAQLIAKDNPNAKIFDLSSLEEAELNYYPIASERVKKNFLETGKFAMSAHLSAIKKKLSYPDQHVVLTGKINPDLYDAITHLVLNRNINAKLTIITPPANQLIAETLTGKTLEITTPNFATKIDFLKDKYPEQALDIVDQDKQLSELESKLLQNILDSQRDEIDFDEYKTDEEIADAIDQQRLQDIDHALDSNPWVMIEGPTGIGKTYFIENVYKHKIMSFQDWLPYKPKNGERPTVIFDEANFLNQLGEENENFFERFKGLRQSPPGILWKGKYYELTPQHKIIFAFNPAAYGAEREEKGFLLENKLSVSFERLSKPYLKARVIKPLLQNTLGHRIDAAILNQIAEPILKKYDWILAQETEECLITPRELKAIVNIIASEIITNQITDPTVIYNLADSITYEIGLQAVSEQQTIANEFQKFKPTHSYLQNKISEQDYNHYKLKDYQLNVFSFMNTVLQARALLTPHQHTDLGLGGIILEGLSGIGKTHVMKAMMEMLVKKGQQVFRISPNMPANEIKTKFQQAFVDGAIVVLEEMNTADIPSRLLNNYLMGLDENGKPAAKPGFFLLATQNPPHMQGRAIEDPALRRRMHKFVLDWPFIPKQQELIKEEALTSTEAEVKNSQIPLPAEIPTANEMLAINQELLYKNIKFLILDHLQYWSKQSFIKDKHSVFFQNQEYKVPKRIAKIANAIINLEAEEKNFSYAEKIYHALGKQHQNDLGFFSTKPAYDAFRTTATNDVYKFFDKLAQVDVSDPLVVNSFLMMVGNLKLSDMKKTSEYKKRG